MGTAQSKILSDRLTYSRELAEKEGKAELEPSFLFQDEVILRISMALFQNIPWAIRYPIPESIKECLEHWNGIPVQSDMIPITHPPSSNTKPCTQLVTWFAFLVTKPKTVEEKIKWRLYCLLFYELNRMCDQVECGITILTELIVLGDTCLKGPIIRKHLQTFISAGQRYSLMSKELDGPGILFFLPKKGGESNWSVRLPVGRTTSGNENRSNILKDLKDSGIVSVAGLLKAHTAAKKILRNYMQTFMSIFYCVHGVNLPDTDLSFNTRPMEVTHTPTMVVTASPQITTSSNKRSSRPRKHHTRESSRVTKSHLSKTNMAQKGFASRVSATGRVKSNISASSVEQIIQSIAENHEQQLERQTKGQDDRHQLITPEHRKPPLTESTIGPFPGRSRSLQEPRANWGQDYETDRNVEEFPQMGPLSLLRAGNQDDSSVNQKSNISGTGDIQNFINKDSATAGDTIKHSGHQRQLIQVRPEAARNMTSFELDKPQRAIKQVYRETSSSLYDHTGQTATRLPDLSQHTDQGISEVHTVNGISAPCPTGNLYNSNNQHWSTSVRGLQFDKTPTTELDCATRPFVCRASENPSSAIATGTYPHQNSIQNTPSVDSVQVMNQQESNDMVSGLDGIQPFQSTIPTNYSQTAIQEPLATSAHTSAINDYPEAPAEPYFFGEAPTELYSLGDPPIDLYYLEGEPPIDLYYLHGEPPIDLYNLGGEPPIDLYNFGGYDGYNLLEGEPTSCV